MPRWCCRRTAHVASHANVAGLKLNPRSSASQVQALLMVEKIEEAKIQPAKIATHHERYFVTLAMLGRAAGANAATIQAGLNAVDRNQSNFHGWSLADLTTAALSGNRAEADRRDAIIDAQPAGPFALVVATAACLCGAPFELSATPQLRAWLAESGLHWPPTTTIPYQPPQRQPP